MGTLQSTFNTVPAVAYAGMRVSTEPEHVISRTYESATALEFGQPAYRGSDDHGCISGTTQAGTAAAVAGSANTGNGAMGAITVSAGAKQGVYTLEITAAASNAGAFRVTDPDGVFVDDGDVAAAFSAGGLAFTLADGSTDFVVGDTFAITVTFTANAKLLGFNVPDLNVPASVSAPDATPQNHTASLMTEGMLWVVAGATVSDGEQAYWNPATKRYTNTATHVLLPGCIFDTSGVDGGFVRLSIRNRIQ